MSDPRSRARRLGNGSEAERDCPRDRPASRTSRVKLCDAPPLTGRYVVPRRINLGGGSTLPTRNRPRLASRSPPTGKIRRRVQGAPLWIGPIVRLQRINLGGDLPWKRSTRVNLVPERIDASRFQAASSYVLLRPDVLKRAVARPRTLRSRSVRRPTWASGRRHRRPAAAGLANPSGPRSIR